MAYTRVSSMATCHTPPPLEETDFDPPDPNGIRQRIRNGEWEEIERRLTDLEFIAEACARSEEAVWDLLEDYTLALDAWPDYERYRPFETPRVPEWERAMILETLAAADHPGLHRYAPQGVWPEEGGSHEETCLRVCFADHCTKAGIDPYSGRLEGCPAGRVELFFLFVRECASELAASAVCPTVVVEQAHQRARSGLVARQAEALMAKSSQAGIPSIVYAETSRRAFAPARPLECVRYPIPRSVNGNPCESLYFSEDDWTCGYFYKDGIHAIRDLKTGRLRRWNAGKFYDAFSWNVDVSRGASFEYNSNPDEFEGRITLWDMVALTPLHIHTVNRIHSNLAEIGSFNLSPDARMAAWTADGKSYLLDFDRGEEIELPGRWAAATRNWDRIFRVTQTSLQGHETLPAVLHVFDTRSRTDVETVTLDQRAVTAIAIDEAGRRAVISVESQGLLFWDADFPDQMDRQSNPRNCYPIQCGAVFFPDGKKVLIWTDFDHAIEVRTLGMPGERVIHDLGASIRKMQIWHQDGLALMISGVFKTPDNGPDQSETPIEYQAVGMVDLRDGSIIRSIDRPEWRLHVFDLCKDRRRVFSTLESSSIVWDIEGGIAAPDHESRRQEARFFPPVAASRWASAWESGTHRIEVWDFDAGRFVEVLEKSTGWIFGHAVSPDGRRAVTAHSGAFVIHEIPGGGKILEIPSTREKPPVERLAISPCGQRAVTIGRWQENNCLLWNLGTGKRVRRLLTHPPPHKRKSPLSDEPKPPEDWLPGQESIQFLPCGKRALATLWEDNQFVVVFWNLETGEPLQRLPHKARVVRFVASPDGKRVLSFCAGDIRILWDLETGRKIDAPEEWKNLERFRPGFPSLSLESLGDTLRVRNPRSGKDWFFYISHNPWHVYRGKDSLRIVIRSVADIRIASIRLPEREPLMATPYRERRACLAACPCCGSVSRVPKSTLEAIRELERGLMQARKLAAHGERASLSPFLELDKTAWDREELWRGKRSDHACPSCQAPLRYHPWILGEKNFL
jgi:WD40 repeat protein